VDDQWLFLLQRDVEKYLSPVGPETLHKFDVFGSFFSQRARCQGFSTLLRQISTNNLDEPLRTTALGEGPTVPVTPAALQWSRGMCIKHIYPSISNQAFRIFLFVIDHEALLYPLGISYRYILRLPLNFVRIFVKLNFIELLLGQFHHEGLTRHAVRRWKY